MAGSEKAVQAQIVHLLQSVGAVVYVLGTRRPRGDYQGTRQTPGLPDLIAFTPRGADTLRALLMVECKAKGGRLRPAQAQFQSLCALAGVAHIVGGVEDVLRWLVGRGLVRVESLSAERQAAIRAEKEGAV